MAVNQPGQSEGEVQVEARRCFVIGPIGNRLAEHGTPERLAYEEAIEVLEEVILPACEAVGLSPVRADGLGRAGEIPDQVFRRLRDDDVVIADLTGANANVMYELGLRHTRDKLTVQVGEYSRLPFDVNVIRTVQFSRSPNGLRSARDELIELLRVGLEGEFDPVTATRIWHDDSLSTGAALGVATPASEEVEDGGGQDEGDVGEPGFLDLVAAAEDGQEQLTDALTSVTELLEELGQLSQAIAGEMAQSDARGRGMRGRLAVAVQFAVQLAPLADQVEAHVNDYVAAMDDVSAGNLAIIARLTVDPSQLDEAETYALSTRRLAATARESLSELSTLTDAMSETAKLTRVLRPPTNKLVTALQQLSRSTAVMDQWDRRLQELGVPVPPPEWEPPDEDSVGGEQPQDISGDLIT